MPGSGSPHYSLQTGFQFNGPAFNGFVNRPRQGALGAVTYYTDIGGNSHNFKAGVDYQHLESSSQFGFVNNQVFRDLSYNFRDRTFVPDTRRDYDPPVASTSDGKIWAVYARDKFELGKHLFLELGFRYEHQNSNDDINRITVSAGTISPRHLGVLRHLRHGQEPRRRDVRPLLPVRAAGLLRRLRPERAAGHVRQLQLERHGVRLFVADLRVGQRRPDPVEPQAHVHRRRHPRLPAADRQHDGRDGHGHLPQVGQHHRRRSDPGRRGQQTVTYTNYAPGARKFYGIEAVVRQAVLRPLERQRELRLGQDEDEHHVERCELARRLPELQLPPGPQELDLSIRTIGTGGFIPCSVVNDGPNKTGQPTLSINHSVKAAGAYAQSVGPVNLALGLGGAVPSGIHYQQQRTMNDPHPGHDDQQRADRDVLLRRARQRSDADDLPDRHVPRSHVHRLAHGRARPQRRGLQHHQSAEAGHRQQHQLVR